MKTKLNKNALIDLAQAFYNYPDDNNIFRNLPWYPLEEERSTFIWEQLPVPHYPDYSYEQKCRDTGSALYSEAAIL